MSTGLIELIKRASLDAMDNAQMCDMRYGKVVSVSPLKVQVTNQFTIPASLLVVPQHLTNYEVECTITHPSITISGNTGSATAGESHKHSFSGSSGETTSKSTVKIHNALKVEDKVVLLRKQGGQSYFILDRI
jgi:hypothetical protein